MYDGGEMHSCPAAAQSFEVPSGLLYIGDADDSDEVALQPGRWLLQFNVDDAGEARHVDLVIAPI